MFKKLVWKMAKNELYGHRLELLFEEYIMHNIDKNQKDGKGVTEDGITYHVEEISLTPEEEREARYAKLNLPFRDVTLMLWPFKAFYSELGQTLRIIAPEIGLTIYKSKPKYNENCWVTDSPLSLFGALYRVLKPIKAFSIKKQRLTLLEIKKRQKDLRKNEKKKTKKIDKYFKKNA